MAHYGNVEITATTPKEWLAVGAKLGQLVNEWSGRNDLAVLIAHEISNPSPALYNPTSSEIEVSIPMAFGIGTTPTNLGDLSDKAIQYENAKAIGVIYHESCHARFSRYSLEDASKALTENEFGALHLLEESRIEHWGITAIPSHREFLRSSALEIVLAEIDTAVEKMSAIRAGAYLSGLTLARIDAGVLDAMDLVSVSEFLDGLLGAENVARLREVWVEFQSHADHTNAEPLYALARKWESIVKELSEQAGQEPENGQDRCKFPIDGEDGEDGESGEKGKGRGTGRSISEMLDALTDDADNTMLSSRESLDRQQTAEDWDKEVKARQSSAKRNADHKKIAKQIIEQNKRGNEPSCDTNSKFLGARKPTAIERSSAVLVAKLLEKAKYRERDVVVHNQVLPAGKLRTRTIVQAQALKAKGIHNPIEMWKNKTRKQTDEPTLSIGVMVDISGSMGSAMEPMATTAWVLSEAGRRVQARTSMVYFGSDVFTTLKAGQHLEEVLTYSANDYTEKFDKAFQATDGMLNLLNGNGARLLVVVSDGQYTNEETKKAKDWLAECKRSGVAVLWIGYDKSVAGARDIINGTDAELVSVSNDVAEASRAIGEMASRVLSKMGERNSY
jgi:hypothetical protein